MTKEEDIKSVKDALEQLHEAVEFFYRANHDISTEEFNTMWKVYTNTKQSMRSRIFGRIFYEKYAELQLNDSD